MKAHAIHILKTEPEKILCHHQGCQKFFQHKVDLKKHVMRLHTVKIYKTSKLYQKSYLNNSKNYKHTKKELINANKTFSEIEKIKAFIMEGTDKEPQADNKDINNDFEQMFTGSISINNKEDIKEKSQLTDFEYTSNSKQSGEPTIRKIFQGDETISPFKRISENHISLSVKKFGKLINLNRKEGYVDRLSNINTFQTLKNPKFSINKKDHHELLTMFSPTDKTNNVSELNVKEIGFKLLSNTLSESVEKHQEGRGGEKLHVIVPNNLDKPIDKHIADTEYHLETMRQEPDIKITLDPVYMYTIGKPTNPTNKLVTANNSYQRAKLLWGKKFKCEKCDSSFVQKSLLERHNITHSKICLYKCNYCDKNFTNITSLKNHTFKKHPEKIEEKLKLLKQLKNIGHQ